MDAQLEQVRPRRAKAASIGGADARSIDHPPAFKKKAPRLAPAGPRVRERWGAESRTAANYAPQWRQFRDIAPDEPLHMRVTAIVGVNSICDGDDDRIGISSRRRHGLNRHKAKNRNRLTD